MSLRPLVIVGAGGMAREVALWVEHINARVPTWHFLGFVVPENTTTHPLSSEYPLFGSDAALLAWADEPLAVILALGQPERLLLLSAQWAAQPHLYFPNLIHPEVFYDPRHLHMGQGNIICPRAVLTTNISMGDFNIVNFQTAIGHDTTLGNANVLNPGVNCSGGVRIGNANLIGAGATLLQNIEIGDYNRIGAGAVVTSSISGRGHTAVGVPARVVRSRSV